jgi:hypothetical protein
MRKSPKYHRGSSPLQRQVIEIIQVYTDEYLFEPANNWPLYFFEERSYSRWATNELINYIEEHADITPTDAIKDFIDKVSTYAVQDTYNNRARRIFYIARDIATDMLRAVGTMP